MDADALTHVANTILNQTGLGPASGPFTAEVAWEAHRRANERAAAGTILRALLDIEDSLGRHSGEAAVVQAIVNCGPVPLEDYPIPCEVWSALGFEVYTNGDGSHGAHIPMWLRRVREVAH